MNGVHDMGGMQDMGPVRPEKSEPVFHAAWEGRVFAMYEAIDGDWPGRLGALPARADSTGGIFADELLRALADELCRNCWSRAAW